MIGWQSPQIPTVRLKNLQLALLRTSKVVKYLCPEKVLLLLFASWERKWLAPVRPMLESSSQSFLFLQPLSFSSVQSDPWLDELDKSIPNSKFNYSNFFDPNPALTFSFGNK